MIKILYITPIIFSLVLSSCNTVVGSAKGIGRDIKAVYIYTRDSVTDRPISDK